jgi:hypothetical protein
MRHGAVILVCLVPLSAAAQTRLEWRFNVGDSFLLERVYRQKQEIEVKGRSFKHDVSTSWLTRVAVKEKHFWQWVLQVTFEEVSYKNDGAMNPALFDDKLAERLKGLSLSLVVTSRGEVKKMIGYDEFVAKLSEGKKDVEKVVRALFSEAGLREGFEEVLGFVPHKAVTKGQTWQREAVDPLPPFGSFHSEFDYRYEGMRDGLHAVAYGIRTTYRKPGDGHDLFKVVKGSLSAEDGKGVYLFDVEAGRLVRGDKSMVVRGEVTIEAGGMETTLRFVSENQLKVRVTAGK